LFGGVELFAVLLAGNDDDDDDDNVLLLYDFICVDEPLRVTGTAPPTTTLLE